MFATPWWIRKENVSHTNVSSNLHAALQYPVGGLLMIWACHGELATPEMSRMDY
jgi:hypothetical protein